MDNKRHKRPTQQDAAKLAGVSRTTVSLVLNKHCSNIAISQETREQVLAAAREIGYSPNPVAQMLEQSFHILLFSPKEGVYQNGMNSILLTDGAILTGTYPDTDALRRLAEEEYPFVLLGECDIPTEQIDSVRRL